MRLLTSFLLARARLAEIEGRTNDAFRVYLETYRFTHEIGRGGLALDFLMQIVCEHIVLKSFSSFFPSLSSSQCAETLRLIDDMEADQEELQVLLRRDRRWLHATYDFSTRVKARMSLWREAAREVWRTHSLVALNDSSSTRELLAQAQQRHQKEIADVRQQLRRQLSGDRIKALP